MGTSNPKRGFRVRDDGAFDGAEQGSVRPGPGPDHEAPGELPGVERPFDREGQLVERELVAEAVGQWLDGQATGAARRVGVAAVHPAVDANPLGTRTSPARRIAGPSSGARVESPGTASARASLDVPFPRFAARVGSGRPPLSRRRMGARGGSAGTASGSRRPQGPQGRPAAGPGPARTAGTRHKCLPIAPVAFADSSPDRAESCELAKCIEPDRRSLPPLIDVFSDGS